MARQKLKTLSEQMFYILLVLDQERCGVEIVKAVNILTQGRIHLGPGTLYVILAQFEEEGLIEQTKVEGRRRSYQISEAGKQLLEEETSRLKKMLFDIIAYQGGELT